MGLVPGAPKKRMILIKPLETLILIKCDLILFSKTNRLNKNSKMSIGEKEREEMIILFKKD